MRRPTRGTLRSPFLRSSGPRRCLTSALFLAAACSGTPAGDSTGTGDTPVLAAVTITPASFTATAGDTIAFTAAPRDQFGHAFPGARLAWGATGGTVAASGRFVAGSAAGNATVFVTADGAKSDTARGTVTALPVAVAAVTVEPATLALVAGQGGQLTATPRDAGGAALSGRAVAWRSLDTTIATVSAAGAVHATAPGQATITATSEGRSGSATITVSPVPIDHVVVTPGAASISVGGTVALTASARDAANNPLTGRSCSWSSANTAIITVSDAGIAAGVAPGSASALATCDGIAGGSTITVSAVPVASVAVTPATPAVTVGATVQLTATPKDANGSALTGRTVSWSTSAGSIASVSASGLVTGVAAGSATITATSEGQHGAATVTVSPVAIDHVVVSPGAASITVGQTVSLTSSPRDAANNPLAGRSCAWSSGNASIIAVSAAGVVTGLAPGSASAISTCEGVAGASTITVSQVPVASVTVTPSSSSLAVGATVQLTATPKDANGNALTGRTVTWGSSATAVATVSATGLVAGAGAGTATITATSGGVPGTASVTVTGGSSSVVDTVFYDGFEGGSLSRWDDEGAPSTHAVVTVAPHVHGGTHGLDITYPSGADGGWLTKFFMPGYDSASVSYWIKLDSGWTSGSKLVSFYGARTDNQWSASGKAGVCPNGSDFFVATLTADPSPQMRMRFYTQYAGMPSSGGTCYGSGGAAGTTYTPDPFQLSAGTWHYVQFWVKLNTIGSANGEQSFWVDGQLRGTWTGITFRTDTVLRLNSATITASSPGGTTQVRHMYIDDFLVTRQRPAP